MSVFVCCCVSLCVGSAHSRYAGAVESTCPISCCSHIFFSQSAHFYTTSLNMLIGACDTRKLWIALKAEGYPPVWDYTG